MAGLPGFSKPASKTCIRSPLTLLTNLDRSPWGKTLGGNGPMVLACVSVDSPPVAGVGGQTVEVRLTESPPISWRRVILEVGITVPLVH